MRIISDFHDYYDPVQATGQDQTLIYFRKREEVEVAEYPFPVFPCYRWGDEPRSPKAQQYVVGFCGKIYPVLNLSLAGKDEKAVCHNLDEVDRFVELNFRRQAIEEYRTRSKRRWRGPIGPVTFDGTPSRNILRNVPPRKAPSSRCSGKRDARYTLARPGDRWGASGGRIVYNASLKELEFYRLFDPYTAFQEIAMFLGGLAVPHREIPDVPDKIMVGAKGFDQWSFRKPPSRGKA